MEFVFETPYDQKTLTIMARALRKTVRRKKSIRNRILGVIVLAVLGFLIWLTSGTDKLYFNQVLNVALFLGLAAVLLFEDRINGYLVAKRTMTGVKRSRLTFQQEQFLAKTNLGTVELEYRNLEAIAETGTHLVFLFRNGHARICDKRTITGGTLEEFRTFIEARTSLQIQKTR